MRKRWQYRLIRLLDRSPRMCWANLVCWVEFGQRGGKRRLRDCRIDWMCREDAAKCGTCYCGKLTDVASERASKP